VRSICSGSLTKLRLMLLGSEWHSKLKLGANAVLLQVALPRHRRRNRPRLQMRTTCQLGRKEIGRGGELKKKIEKLLEIEKTCPQSDTALTTNAKKWCRTTMRPALRCLRGHFGGNVELFCEAWDRRSTGRSQGSVQRKWRFLRKVGKSR
jgi:hypothetical protein